MMPGKEGLGSWMSIPGYMSFGCLQANVVAPNKHITATETMYRGHLLENETYIGGKVEALQSGVFRSDLPTRFRCKPAAYQVP